MNKFNLDKPEFDSSDPEENSQAVEKIVNAIFAIPNIRPIDVIKGILAAAYSHDKLVELQITKYVPKEKEQI